MGSRSVGLLSFQGGKPMHWLEMFITVVCAVLGSSGIWTLIQKKNENKDAKTQMLIGLGHDRVMTLGMEYIERGCITKDEYENLVDYLYKPYEMMGGNGSAARIIDEVKKLPLSSDVNCDHKKEKG